MSCERRDTRGFAGTFVEKTSSAKAWYSYAQRLYSFYTIAASRSEERDVQWDLGRNRLHRDGERRNIQREEDGDNTGREGFARNYRARVTRGRVAYGLRSTRDWKPEPLWDSSYRCPFPPAKRRRLDAGMFSCNASTRRPDWSILWAWRPPPRSAPLLRAAFQTARGASLALATQSSAHRA